MHGRVSKIAGVAIVKFCRFESRCVWLWSYSFAAPTRSDGSFNKPVVGVKDSNNTLLRGDELLLWNEPRDYFHDFWLIGPDGQPADLQARPPHFFFVKKVKKNIRPTFNNAAFGCHVDQSLYVPLRYPRILPCISAGCRFRSARRAASLFPTFS
jgi:hypothetical protein